MTSVDLAPSWIIGSVDLTAYPFSVDRDDTVAIGEPEMVVERNPSLLADGDLERVVRHGNRDYLLDVYIEGPTLGDLAQSEALLRAELRRERLELTHNPGDDFSATSVYEVHTAALTPTRSDTHESHLIRKYRLTLRCSPFARSLTAVTVEALAEPPVTPTVVTVDACDSTAGWTAESYTQSGYTNPQLVFDGGAYVYAGFSGIFEDRLRSGAMWVDVSPVSLSATPYLLVELSGTALQIPGVRVSFEAAIDAVGVALSPTVARANPSGTVLYVIPTSGGSLSRVKALVTFPTPPPGFPSLEFHDISRSDVIPQVTKRQHTRILEVGGTERTPASIHVYSGYDLADTQSIIVHTCPEDGSGYSPPLRRWKVSGNTATDSEGDTMSLFSEPLKPEASTCEVPNTALPAGGYVLAARLRASVATLVGLDWAVHSFFPDAVDPEEGAVFGSTPWTAKVATEWEIVPLAVLTLPTVRGVGGKTRVSVFCGALDSDVFWDEMWLFRVDDDCALTIVENHPPDHLWLDSANSQSPVPTVWQGWEADRSDARHPGTGLTSWDNHVLHPDGTATFTAAITNDLRVEASFHRRWHSNAAE